MKMSRKQHKAASDKFMEAIQMTKDAKTKYALRLLADSHLKRANDRMLSTIEQESVNVSAQEKETSIDSSGSALPTELLGLETTERTSISETEVQLEQTEEELDELWRQLNELGLSRQMNADRQSVLLGSSRHLSSALGDSFCLLPTKARGLIGAGAKPIDGGATLRAAAASRLRSQRERLIKTSSPVRSKSPTPALSSLNSEQQSLITHQKHEIMRLLQSIKTLSAENTSLIKECEDRALIVEQNKVLKEKMREFQEQYQHKFIALKRALKEWRRQKEKSDADPLEKEIDRLKQENQIKDEKIQRYENWYRNLKAGAIAKKQSRSFEE